MRTFALCALLIQAATFIALGFYFVSVGQIRLGVAQLLLAAVQLVIYGGGFG